MLCNWSCSATVDVLETDNVLETSILTLIFYTETMFSVFFQFTAVSGTIFIFFKFRQQFLNFQPGIGSRSLPQNFNPKGGGVTYARSRTTISDIRIS
jgi:hypothetical protein